MESKTLRNMGGAAVRHLEFDPIERMMRELDGAQPIPGVVIRKEVAVAPVWDLIEEVKEARIQVDEANEQVETLYSQLSDQEFEIRDLLDEVRDLKSRLEGRE